MNTKLVGAMGEAAAAEYLRRKNYKIVAMNRTRYGEIDIIAADRKHLLFVEVKLRRNKRFAEAREHGQKKADKNHKHCRDLAI